MCSFDRVNSWGRRNVKKRKSDQWKNSTGCRALSSQQAATLGFALLARGSAPHSYFLSAIATFKKSSRLEAVFLLLRHACSFASRQGVWLSPPLCGPCLTGSFARPPSSSGSLLCPRCGRYSPSAGPLAPCLVRAAMRPQPRDSCYRGRRAGLAARSYRCSCV